MSEINTFSALNCDISLQQDDIDVKKNEINCNNVMLNSSNCLMGNLVENWPLGTQTLARIQVCTYCYSSRIL